MNKEILEGKWDQIKGELKSKWADLTEDEIMKTQGNSQAILGLLKERYGMEKDKALEELNSFLENIKDKLK